jgi:FHS family L-fucose permease-like MFS transporter
MSKNEARFAIVLITSLFFLWGLAINLNPILIPHLKKACQLSDLESGLIDSATFFAYFVMAIPAGRFMERFGYKGGIITGLLLFSLGAFLFFPAAETRSFVFFLTALFIIACGLTFLETAANPYITVLGDPDKATQRINFAQSFNGLAATIAPYLGGRFILSGKNLTEQEEATMAPDQLTAYLNMEASAVKVPFIVVGIVVLTVAIFFWRTRLPEIVEDKEQKKSGSIWKERNLILGVIAQFFYVGAQVCVSSFFIRFSHLVAGIEEKAAAGYLSVALAGFMIGRFVGTVLLNYISASRLLAIYSLANVVLLTFAVMLDGMFSIYALMAVQFFMSIMFPTIFSLSIRGLGSRTKQGASLVIMSIVGGAVLPVIMGGVSDVSNIQLAYSVPAACFVVILYYALKNADAKELATVTRSSH